MGSLARLARLLGATFVVCACGEPTPPQVASPLGLESLGSVAPLDVVRLSASGGRPPYVFALSLAASGGTVSGRLYQVGEVGAVVDELRVTDVAGGAALVRVSVGPALDVGPLLRELDSAATLAITPTGGAPPYRCDLASSCGGRLMEGGACRYRAGLVRGEDRLRVSDANGVTRTVRLLIGQVFAVSPEAAQVAPGEQRILGAFGGARRYRFALEVSPSGATIDTHTGVYVAGPVGEVTDVALVTDGESQAKVPIQVGPSLSLSPVEASVDPSRSLDLKLQGGKSPYRVELDSPSGGSLDLTIDGALYTAGPTGGVTDILTAIDVLGTQARAVLTVRLGPRFAPAVADVAPRETLELSLLATTGVASFRMAQAQSGGTVASTGDSSALYTAGVSGLTQDIALATGPWGYPIRATLRVGPALAVTPDLLSLPSGAQVTLTASGGKAPYRFSLVSPSGGQLFTSGAAASYVAGPKAGVTDEVTAIDALGTERIASLEVLPGPHFADAELYAAPREGLELVVYDTAGPVDFALSSAPSGASLLTSGDTTAVYTAGAAGNVDDLVEATGPWAYPLTVRVHVGAELALTPLVGSLITGRSLTVTAEGGKPPYVFSLTSASQGSLVPAGDQALYTAGSLSPVVDEIAVLDAVGARVQAVFQVLPAPRFAPAELSLAPQESVTLTVVDTAGPVEFALASAASQAKLVATGPQTALYTAGPAGNLADVVVATGPWGFPLTATMQVGAALLLSPQEASVPVGTGLTLTASGGKPPYVFSLVAKGGSLVPGETTARFTAGATAGPVEQVIVKDAVGAESSALLTTLAGPRFASTSYSAAPTEILELAVLDTAGPVAFAFQAVPSGGAVEAASATTAFYTAGPTGAVEDVVVATGPWGYPITTKVQVLPALALTPLGPTLLPGSETVFTASGGKPPYSFALKAPSGGSLLASGATATYTAGETPATDEVTVKDALGVFKKTSVGVVLGPHFAYAEQSVAPGEGIDLEVLETAGPTEFALVLSPSGSTVSATGATTARYAAGPTGNVDDVVQASGPWGSTIRTVVHVGPMLGLAQTQTEVLRKEQVTVTASGGKAPYAFFLSSLSGGTLSASTTTGVYTAGTTTGVTDTVTVKDAVGMEAKALVAVLVGPHFAMAETSAAPTEAVTLTVLDTAGPVTFSLAASPSGGSAVATSATTALYTAGATGSVDDVVTAIAPTGDPMFLTVHVLPALGLAPASATATPGKETIFAASGGKKPYVYSLVTASGATLLQSGDAATYTAGSTVDVKDEVTVKDALGVTRKALVTVVLGPHFALAEHNVAPTETLDLTVLDTAGPVDVALLTAPSGGLVKVTSATTARYGAGTTGAVDDVVEATGPWGYPIRTTVHVSPALSLAQSQTEVIPLGKVTFTAKGGQAPYLFALASPSGGSLAASGSTATYTAGLASPAVDRVTVTDALGVARSLDVTVLVGPHFAAAELYAAPLEAVTLTVLDTAGPVAFAMAAAPSGGSVATSSATAATFTAGPVGGGDDVVSATGDWGYVFLATIHVGPSLSLSPLGATVTAGASLTFAAAGGKAPYAFEAVSLSSGGSITSAGGYTAGGTAGTDQLRLRDAVGAAVTTTVKVEVPPPPPLALSPTAADVAPGGTQMFTASGGCAGYGFTLVAPAAGTLSLVPPDRVSYTAPALRTTEVVRLTDGCGATVDARVHTPIAPALTYLWPRGGAPGNYVTIVGTDFDAMATVRFGTVGAALERASSTALVVKVPAFAAAGPTTVAVSVATADGTAASPLGFVVLAQATPLPLVYRYQPTAGNIDLYLTDTYYGRAPLRLTSYAKKDYQAAISQDGRWLAYLSDKDSSGGGGKYDVYRIDLYAPGPPVPTPLNMTQTPALDEALPGFGPDGVWLYFTRNATQILRVQVAAANPAVTVQVVDDGGTAQTTGNLAFTPDGRYLFFVSSRSGRNAVYRKAADGSGAASRVSTLSVDEDYPWVSPRGDRVYFTAYGLQSPTTTSIVYVDPETTSIAPTVLPAPPLPKSSAAPRISWDASRSCVLDGRTKIWCGDLDASQGDIRVMGGDLLPALFVSDNTSFTYTDQSTPMRMFRYDLATSMSVGLGGDNMGTDAVSTVPLP